MRNKIIAVVIASLMALTTIGCGKKTEEPVNANTEVTAEEAEPVEDEVSVTNTAEEPELPNLATMSKDEFYTLDMDTFKAALESQSPSYRDHFQIPSDKQLGEDDWANIKDMTFWELFGQDVVEYEKENGLLSYQPDVTVEETYAGDPSLEIDEETFYTPTREYLESLTDEEFFYWYNEWNKFWFNGEDFMIPAGSDLGNTEPITIMEAARLCDDERRAELRKLITDPFFEDQ